MLGRVQGRQTVALCLPVSSCGTVGVYFFEQEETELTKDDFFVLSVSSCFLFFILLQLSLPATRIKKAPIGGVSDRGNAREVLFLNS